MTSTRPGCTRHEKGQRAVDNVHSPGAAVPAGYMGTPPDVRSGTGFMSECAEQALNTQENHDVSGDRAGKYLALMGFFIFQVYNIMLCEGADV